MTRFGYLQDTETETLEDGRQVIVAFYCDSEGEEVGFREFEPGDKIPEMEDFGGCEDEYER